MSQGIDTGGTRICGICHQALPVADLVPGAAVRPAIASVIQSDHPGWSPDQSICLRDLARFRAQYVHALLEQERGEVSTLEQEVVNSLHRHELLSTNIEERFEGEWTKGQRIADQIATFGGSWTFLVAFGVFIFLWIVMNSLVLLWRPFDPYPFILLNLILSCLAAIQAPVIMMSQNRQEAKDRVRSQHDFQVNLKAELEIRHLNEKVDHLLSHQWERLVQIQEIQLEVLEELGRLSRHGSFEGTPGETEKSSSGKPP
jgi:uncharacterized membrane protein